MDRISPSTEERVWAALAHISALGMGMGLLLPLIGWSEYRRKSKYVAFQSLQALGYQTLGYTLWFLVYLLAFVLLFVGIIALGSLFPRLDENTVILSMMIFVFAAVIAPMGVYLLVPVAGAVACALGRDFRYPFMGKLETYLNGEAGDGWFDAAREDRWVAAMGHFSVIIMLWSLILPGAAFFLQGKRSLFLKFQSLQTLVYQAAGTLGYFGVSTVLGIVGFVFAVVVGNDPFLDSTVIIVIAMGFLIFTMLLLLLLPLYHILGQWAGLRTLQGRDYRYPLVGRLVGRWVKTEQEEAV